MALVSYYNPLAPIATKTEQIVATNTKQLRENIIFDCVAYDLVVAKNDVIIEEDCDILETDVIGLLLIPKGGGGGNSTKQILSTVAAIAIMVYAPEMSAYLIGSAEVAVTATEFYALTAAIGMAGSMLVGSVLAPKMDIDTSGYSSSDISSSATYGWNTQTNMISQGDVIPRLYGTARIFPRMISKYVETIDDKQYLNMLYLVNDGYTTNISDIKINNESINNFNNIDYEVRSGENEQTLIPRFNNLRADKIVNKKLNVSNYSISNTDGNSVIALEVGLVFPKGLFYANDSGGLDSYSVNISLEYSTDQVDWVAFGDATISNSVSSTFRKTFKSDTLAPAKYHIRAKLITAPETSSRYSSDCYFEYITEEVGDDFTYPNMALLAVTALATDQLSGSMPTVSCIATSRSNNPALICKDMLLNSGVLESRISSKFDEWADFCEDNNLTCNIYFDTKMSIRQALNMVSVLGRASVVQFGSRFEVIIEKAQILPTQGFTFGLGNILKDTFKQSFLPLKDRANIIEATFYNEENDYEKEVFELSNSQFDDIDETNKASVNLIGCTNKTQALELAKLQLNYNNYITQTFTFQADADALYCKVGDIVRISHDVPRYGFSGRIVSSTNLSVVLDREVEMDSVLSYVLQVRRNADNEIVQIPVINTGNTTDTLTLIYATDPFEQYDNYSFGEINRASVKARVLSIRTDGDMLRELTCIEYNETVYDTSHTPVVDYVSSLSLSDIRVNDFIRYAKDRSIETVVNITWSGSSLYYDVMVNNTTTRVYETYFNASNLEDGKIYSISIKDSQGNTKSTTYEVKGKLAKPNDVDTLSCSEIGNNFKLTWTHDLLTTDIDFLEYVIYYQGNEIGRTKNKEFTYYSYGLDAKTFTVKCTDTSSVLSDGVQVVITAVAPNAVTNLAINEGLDEWELSWSYGYMPTDFKSFLIYQDYDLVGETTGFVFNTKINKTQSRFRVIAIDTAGNYSTFTEQVKTIATLDDINTVNTTFVNNNVLMFWDTIKSDKTPIVYEIRKGTVWANAQFVESTQDFKTTIYSNGTYLIKPTYTFASGYKIEATNAISIVADEAQLIKNMLVTWNELTTGWLGTKTNTVKDLTGNLTLDVMSSGTTTGIYEIPTAHIVNLSTPKVCTLSYNLEHSGIALGSNFDLFDNVDLINSVDGTVTSDFNVEVQIAISQDGTTYSDYKKFIAGDYLGQAFKFRLILTSYNEQIAPYVTNFEFTVDMPDLYEAGNSVSTTSSKTITYANNFSTAPDVQITIVNATAGDDAILTNQTDESFDIIIKNSGANVVRTFNYFVKGY
jgi:predicted phage tail protein